MSIYAQIDLFEDVDGQCDIDVMLDAIEDAFFRAVLRDDAVEITRLREIYHDLLNHPYEAAETICDDLDNALAAAIVRMNEVAA